MFKHHLISFLEENIIILFVGLHCQNKFLKTTFFFFVLKIIQLQHQILRTQEVEFGN